MDACLPGCALAGCDVGGGEFDRFGYRCDEKIHHRHVIGYMAGRGRCCRCLQPGTCLAVLSMIESDDHGVFLLQQIIFVSIFLRVIFVVDGPIDLTG